MGHAPQEHRGQWQRVAGQAREKTQTPAQISEISEEQEEAWESVQGLSRRDPEHTGSKLCER